MTRRAAKRAASSLSDHAKVRGVRRGRSNTKASAKAASRKGVLRRALIASGAVLGFAGVGYGLFELHAWAVRTPRLSIATVEIFGAQRADSATLHALADVQVGASLIALDSDAVAARILEHPWVATVDVQKGFPRTLRVEVTEHDPVALVALQNLYYLNRRGEIVKRYAPGESVALPVITGLSRAQVEDGDPASAALMRGALDFLSAWNGFHESTPPRVSEVHVDQVMGLSFVLREDETRVNLGWAPYTEKFERWMKVRATLEARGVVASQITMSGSRHPERVVAELRARESAGVASRSRSDRGLREGAKPTVVAAGPRRDIPEDGR